MKRHVAIFGGGIAGMTAAQELIEKGFSVSIYEKDSSLGGMAKSKRNLYDGIPTEHSWRGYARFYYNLFDIIRRIPLQIETFALYTMETIKRHNTRDSLWTVYQDRVYDITRFVPTHPGGSIILKAGGRRLEDVWKENGVQFHESSQTVMNILRDYEIGTISSKTEHFGQSVYDNLNHDNISFKITTGSYVMWRDIPYLFYSHLKTILSSSERRDKLYTTVKDNVSASTWDYLAYFLAGPGFGFDVNTVGLRQYASFLAKTIMKSGWTVMSRPTSEAWLEPWKRFLRSVGVRMNTNSTLTKIHVRGDTIISCEVVTDGVARIITADEYCFCINPNLSAPIFRDSGMTELSEQFSELETINNQIGFVIGLGAVTDLPVKGYSINNSPYNITLYPQSKFWRDDEYLGNVKSLWSGTVILPYRKGLSGKTATELNRSELGNEILSQIFRNGNFTRYGQNVLFIRIYDEWKWTGDRLTSDNPKWVNTVRNDSYRPYQKTSYHNFYLGGAHTKTSVDIWSMEGAVESGKLVANLILGKYGHEGVTLYNHELRVIKYLKKLDGILSRLQLPNIVDVILVVIIVMIVTSRKK